MSGSKYFKGDVWKAAHCKSEDASNDMKLMLIKHALGMLKPGLYITFQAQCDHHFKVFILEATLISGGFGAENPKPIFEQHEIGPFKDGDEAYREAEAFCQRRIERNRNLFTAKMEAAEGMGQDPFQALLSGSLTN